MSRLAAAGEVARWFETGVAFARAGRASDETAIACAGEKWAFLVRFSGAEVMSVSTLAVQGRAVVMAVSRWPASAVAEVMSVSTSPRGCVMHAKKFAPRGPTVGMSAKKFTLRWSSMQPGARGWLWWGFCSIRSWLSACRRRVDVLVTPFPPFGDDEIAV